MVGARLIPAKENVQRLKCALASRSMEGPLIISRTDAMPASKIEAVARHVSGPKVVSIVDGNETVALKASDLEEMGFSVVLYAVTALFAAAKAMSDALDVLARDGTSAGAFADLMTYDEFSELVDLAKFQSLDIKLGGEFRCVRCSK
jgi:2-methylisocitrate lyase-like PEP mutase family enzyme